MRGGFWRKKQDAATAASCFHSVDGHIQLEAHDLAQGVLGEVLLADLQDGDLLVGHRRLVVGIDVGLEVCLRVGNAVLLHVVLVREDLSDDGVVRDAAAALALVDDDILHAGDGDQLVLDLLGVDVLAVREDDEVLLAAGDVEDVVLVQLAIVAGAEVAVVVEGVLGGSLVLVVAQHDVRASDADLALAVLVGVANHDGVDIEHGADTAPHHAAAAVDGDDGRALGDAVAVEGRDADGLEEGEDLGVDGRAARDDHLHLAAEGCADGAE